MANTIATATKRGHFEIHVEDLPDFECSACGEDLGRVTDSRTFAVVPKFADGYMIYNIVCNTPECIDVVT